MPGTVERLGRSICSPPSRWASGREDPLIVELAELAELLVLVGPCRRRRGRLRGRGRRRGRHVRGLHILRLGVLRLCVLRRRRVLRLRVLRRGRVLRLGGVLGLRILLVRIGGLVLLAPTVRLP